nr:SMC family ATPase [Streptomyces sp. SID5468]
MTVTAFGPYRGTCEIDFDRLSAAGLFLLHGATGAGKTSVLDAVCYALYGGVPGTRQVTRLRSDHADPNTPTEVVLELTVGDRRLELTRRPEQPRPKKRGAGTTAEKAVSRLRERLPSGEWKALSRSHQEIGEEITGLLGMSREQFCQVVLLPQGDFARFLRADADDRERLLGRLFDTGRFGAAESWLADRRRAAEQRVRAHDERLLALAERIGQAAGPAAETPLPDLAPGEPGTAETVLAWAAAARVTAREHRQAAALALQAAEGAHVAAQAALDEARETAHLQARHHAARTRLAALDALRDETEQARTRLDRAAAADAVTPLLDAHAAAVREHQRAQATEAAARDRLPDGLATADPERLTAKEHQARRRLGTLDAARRAAERAAALTAERDRLDRDAAADEELDREATAWLSGWPPVRDRLARRIDAAHEAAARAEQLAARLDGAHRRLDAARRRDESRQAARDAEARLLRAREEAATAQERWLDLKERRLRGIAAELAAALAPGAPCPVCGAADHPAPATAGAGHVDRAAEEAAHTAYRRAEEERARAEAQCHTLGERLAAALTEAGDDPAARLAAEADELAAAHTEARRAAADLHAAREELTRAEREHAERLALQQQARSRTAARTSRREALERELAALRAELTDPGEADRLAAHARALAEAATAARDTAAAGHRRAEAEGRLAEAARRAGFTGPDEAAAAVLDPATRHRLRRRVEEHHAATAAATAELADPQVRSAADRPAADPEACRRALEAAATRLRTAYAADQTARTRCADLDRLGAQATRHAAELAPLRAEHTRLRRLALLATGQSAENELRMTLESYVLAARLEQVAAAASLRLHRMSGGRYTLEHTDARRSGRGRSGLGLQVIDAWTGTARDTATLSGGETFSASLALALGLADVVTAEAGGHSRLDTLFIDEGFGSLDEQTLDEVLDVLDGLRERDRTVGIVSHVADLRHRIPAQLQVVKGRDGSTVRHRTAAGHADSGRRSSGEE